MVLLGLTGSIGMGKSVAADILRDMGVPVHDADAAAHDLLAHDGDVIASIADAFPGTVDAGAVDRGKLAAAVFGDQTALRCLESILHPRVIESERRFIDDCARDGADLAVLDIPLLYETGAEARVDAVIVVSAPADQQRGRVLRRPGMTPDRFAAIEARQLPDAQKRQQADYLVETGRGKRYTLRSLARIVAQLRDSADQR